LEKKSQKNKEKKLSCFTVHINSEAVRVIP